LFYDDFNGDTLDAFLWKLSYGANAVGECDDAIQSPEETVFLDDVTANIDIGGNVSQLTRGSLLLCQLHLPEGRLTSAVPWVLPEVVFSCDNGENPKQNSRVFHYLTSTLVAKWGVNYGHYVIGFRDAPAASDGNHNVNFAWWLYNGKWEIDFLEGFRQNSINLYAFNIHRWSPDPKVALSDHHSPFGSFQTSDRNISLGRNPSQFWVQAEAFYLPWDDLRRRRRCSKPNQPFMSVDYSLGFASTAGGRTEYFPWCTSCTHNPFGNGGTWRKCRNHPLIHQNFELLLTSPPNSNADDSKLGFDANGRPNSCVAIDYIGFEAGIQCNMPAVQEFTVNPHAQAVQDVEGNVYTGFRPPYIYGFDLLFHNPDPNPGYIIPGLASVVGHYGTFAWLPEARKYGYEAHIAYDEITLGPGFTAEFGCLYETRLVADCVSAKRLIDETNDTTYVSRENEYIQQEEAIEQPTEPADWESETDSVSRAIDNHTWDFRNDMSVYPNPSPNGNFYFHSVGDNTVRFKVFNQFGQEVPFQHTHIDGAVHLISLPDAPDGVYYLQVSCQSGNVPFHLVKLRQ
jgi:hypothetical protein